MLGDIKSKGYDLNLFNSCLNGNIDYTFSEQNLILLQNKKFLVQTTLRGICY